MHQPLEGDSHNRVTEHILLWHVLEEKQGPLQILALISCKKKLSLILKFTN